MTPGSRRLVLGVAALALVGFAGTAAVLAVSSHDAPTSASVANASGTPVATSAAPATPTEESSTGAPSTAFTTTTQATPSYVPAISSTSAAPVATDPVVQPSVEVLVTYSGWDTSTSRAVAGAVIPGVVETDGTCRLDVRQGSSSLGAEAPAVADARTTSCGELAVPGLTSGRWDATVTYSSDDTSATSAPFVIEVP